jgi:hypothetical protein
MYITTGMSDANTQIAAAHEEGHDNFLGDYTGTQDSLTAMGAWVNGQPPSGASNVATQCDGSTSNTYSGYSPPPPPPPTCCNGGATCPAPHYQCNASCQCVYVSPIVIDVADEGFHFTSAQNGVKFDISDIGEKTQISWTDPKYHNAFLALDRDGDGTIDSGKEMFGVGTEQQPSSDPNGFKALAWFDLPENGGNGDGIIDNRDAVWTKLRLWIDANHDGISQLDELHELEEFGIHSIGLDYAETPKQDQFGNLFWLKGHINVNHDAEDDVNRVIYDVVLVLGDRGSCPK